MLFLIYLATPCCLIGMFNPFTPKVFDSEGLSIDILSVRSHRVVLASVCCSAGPLEQERAISFPVFSTPPMPAKPAESPQHSEIEKTQTSPLEDPPGNVGMFGVCFSLLFSFPRRKWELEVFSILGHTELEGRTMANECHEFSYQL